MVATLRKPEIIGIARREGRVTVEGLVEHFGVTPQTIRRDLAELSDAGQLERVHGGAVLPSTTVNIGYNDRRQLNQSSKVDIARRCAKLIPNDCCVFLNIGTTTEAVAAELLQHQGLLVVTNNIHIALILSENPNVDVIVTGGSLRKSDGGLIGAVTQHITSQYRFDFSLIGCSALHVDGDILDFDPQEVAVSRAIFKQSDHIILAADVSKFDRKAPAKIASLANVNSFVTDSRPPPQIETLCRTAGTDLIIVDNS
ncbi:DeoR/GlpR family DNA-binding transcription regulator [uncultured Sulfitobacter sp.]|uniref:DeoR/GlpR family DNA-binding transcription regulator n=1 Tax=uncultured Sulfitobacter sp. TaxID=191468 RepID=UPI002635A76C|nr:DeoR/GlpR family DNA-binding transcription regulator [uncultured Sulfitobacter sp.]